jgi:hypothetical protein
LGLGLIDGMADLRSVVEGRFGEDVRIVSMGQARRWWRRRLGLGAGGTDAHIDQALAAVEERILWSRYGR